MLVTAVLPFCDLRRVMVPAFERLARPGWPSPQGNLDHMRGIGRIEARRLTGFEGWVGENMLALRLPGAALRLPRDLPAAGVERIRLIRKACFFDGLLNGRFEFLFNIDTTGHTHATARAAAAALLETRIVIRRTGFDGPLRKAAPALGRLWALATVRHGSEPALAFVRPSRPVVIIEDDAQAPHADTGTPAGVGLDVALSLDSSSGKPIEYLLISPRGPDALRRGERFRSEARQVRTYLLRLLQNVEGLSLLFGEKLDSVDSDRVQNLLNEYTRQINRSRQRVDGVAPSQIVDYCYSAFERMHPGRIAALRVDLQNSSMRPNLVAKILTFLALCDASNIQVEGPLMETVMGDKFENIDVNNSQGTAIGRGASATVTGSSILKADATLPESLDWLAKQVRASGHEDADAEAAMVAAAAKKAAAGDDDGAVAWLKKSGKWVLDIAAKSGSALLTAFLSAKFGIGG